MRDADLEALLILQDADMRRKGMEQRLALLPGEMDAIIALTSMRNMLTRRRHSIWRRATFWQGKWIRMTLTGCVVG